MIGSGKFAPEFVAAVLTIISPLVGIGALWTLIRTCLSGLLTQPSLRDLEKTCSSAISRLPSDWQKLKRLRSSLYWLILLIGILFLSCLALWIWLQVLAPVPKAKDGVTLAPNAAQVFGSAAIVILGVVGVILNFLWEAWMRIHKEQIDKLRKS
jgi:hypothetical protein